MGGCPAGEASLRIMAAGQGGLPAGMEALRMGGGGRGEEAVEGRERAPGFPACNFLPGQVMAADNGVSCGPAGCAWGGRGWYGPLARCKG